MRAVPEGASPIIPRLYCRDPAAEVEFCTSVFGAVELGRRADSEGNALHAILTINGAMVMIEAESAALPSRPPNMDGSSPVVLYVYVEDVDKTVERATHAGAKVLYAVQNQFWGDRIGWVMDPAGHVWTIATRVEETTAQERSDRWETIKAEKRS